MIRHIVLVRFRPDLPEEARLALLDRVHDLADTLPGLRAACAGRSESPEALERGYQHGFTMDFDSWDALATYQDHPAHRAFSAALLEAAQDGLEGILVFDLPVPEPKQEPRHADPARR